MELNSINLKEEIKAYENKTPTELIHEIRSELPFIMNVLDSVFSGDKKKIWNVVCHFYAAACASDGSFDTDEHRFFTEATGIDISYENMFAAIQRDIKENAAGLANIFADGIGKSLPEFKVSVFHFMLCFIVANGRVSDSEEALLRTILD